MRLAVLAAGNDARGDDALGPLLARRLAALKLPWVEVFDDFQFQVEHVLDLPAEGIALFVDAHCAQREPVRFEPLAPAASCAVASHALAPAEVLAVAGRVGRPLPSCWLLTLAARSFELGAPLSGAGHLALGAGWGLLRALALDPHPRRWARRAARLSAQAVA